MGLHRLLKYEILFIAGRRVLETFKFKYCTVSPDSTVVRLTRFVNNK